MNTLIYEKTGAVARVVFNRPAARNALTPEMLCRFSDAVTAFQADPALRVLVLTGAGEQAFCAGGDLARTLPLMTGARPAEDDWDRRLLADSTVMAASSLRDYPLYKPVIAAINGGCYAAGFEIMLGTDIRIAADHAQFALPEVTRGLIPFAGSLVRLPRQIPYCQAMAFMLTGDAIGAHEAARMGLVNQVLPASEVLPRALAIAARIAANGPLAVQQVKQTVLASSGVPLDAGYRLEDESRRAVFASQDAQEGPRAFMDKRPAVFHGR